MTVGELAATSQPRAAPGAPSYVPPQARRYHSSRRDQTARPSVAKEEKEEEEEEEEVVEPTSKVARRRGGDATERYGSDVSRRRGTASAATVDAVKAKPELEPEPTHRRKKPRTRDRQSDLPPSPTATLEKLASAGRGTKRARRPDESRDGPEDGALTGVDTRSLAAGVAKPSRPTDGMSKRRKTRGSSEVPPLAVIMEDTPAASKLAAVSKGKMLRDAGSKRSNSNGHPSPVAASSPTARKKGSGRKTTRAAANGRTARVLARLS